MHNSDDSMSRPLRIAQIAPLYESVPPKLYGGTEQMVAHLCEELVHRGHEVTLFASGDSTAKARLRPGCTVSLRLSGLDRFGSAYHLPMLSEVFENAECFDIIHSHVDYWSFPLQRLVTVPTVSTMHNRMDQPELACVYRVYRDLPLVAISDAQRLSLPKMNWVSTVLHGLPENLMHFNPRPANYLAFLGRFAPEKRPDLAIEIARQAGVPLKLAAKIDDADREYFEAVIKPLLSSPGVEYIGEISGLEKEKFLGEALALLFPIDWPEPFGLVMIEALACGTPVIARPCGSVSEVLREGVSGYIASNVDDLVAAVRRLSDVSRRSCRDEFERRFTAEQMAANYETVYYDLIDKRRNLSVPKSRDNRISIDAGDKGLDLEGGAPAPTIPENLGISEV